MKKQASSALGVALFFGFAGTQAQAQTNVPPPTPPILTCNSSSTTAGVALKLRDVFNTSNSGPQTSVISPNPVLYTFPNDSRPYWQAGVEKRFAPNTSAYPATASDGVTGSRNGASATSLTGGTGFYDPYPTMPAIDGAWVVMGNQTTSGYGSTGGDQQQVGMNGFNVQLNHNPNVMYYYKFTFTMDPDMDVNKFGITINNTTYGSGLWNADDRIKGVYVNGQLVATTNNGGNLGSFSSTSSSYNASLALPGNTLQLLTNTAWQAAHAGAQPLWKNTGNNEIVFAVLNGGLVDITGNTNGNFADTGRTGMNTSQSLLKILDTQLAQDCTPPSPANDSGTVTSGTGGTAANVLTGDTIHGQPATLGATGNATVQTDPANPWPTGISLDVTTGNVSVANTVQPGVYTVTYLLCDKATIPNCAPATVTITVNPSILPQPQSGNAVSGTPSTPVTNVASGGKVNGSAADVSWSSFFGHPAKVFQAVACS